MSFGAFSPAVQLWLAPGLWETARSGPALVGVRKPSCAISSSSVVPTALRTPCGHAPATDFCPGQAHGVQHYQQQSRQRLTPSNTAHTTPLHKARLQPHAVAAATLTRVQQLQLLYEVEGDEPDTSLQEDRLDTALLAIPDSEAGRLPDRSDVNLPQHRPLHPRGGEGAVLSRTQLLQGANLHKACTDMHAVHTAPPQYSLKNGMHLNGVHTNGSASHGTVVQIPSFSLQDLRSTQLSSATESSFAPLITGHSEGSSHSPLCMHGVSSNSLIRTGHSSSSSRLNGNSPGGGSTSIGISDINPSGPAIVAPWAVSRKRRLRVASPCFPPATTSRDMGSICGTTSTAAAQDGVLHSYLPCPAVSSSMLYHSTNGRLATLSSQPGSHQTSWVVPDMAAPDIHGPTGSLPARLSSDNVDRHGGSLTSSMDPTTTRSTSAVQSSAVKGRWHAAAQDLEAKLLSASLASVDAPHRAEASSASQDGTTTSTASYSSTYANSPSFASSLSSNGVDTTSSSFNASRNSVATSWPHEGHAAHSSSSDMRANGRSKAKSSVPLSTASNGGGEFDSDSWQGHEALRRQVLTPQVQPKEGQGGVKRVSRPGAVAKKHRALSARQQPATLAAPPDAVMSRVQQAGQKHRASGIHLQQHSQQLQPLQSQQQLSVGTSVDSSGVAHDAAVAAPAAWHALQASQQVFSDAEMEHRELTRHICACTAWQQVRELLDANDTSLNTIHISAMLHRLAVLHTEQPTSPAQLPELHETVRVLLNLSRSRFNGCSISSAFRAWELTTLMWAVVKLQHVTGKSFVVDGMALAKRRFRYYTAQGLAELLWTVAHSGMRKLRPDWQDQYCQALRRLAPTLSPQGAAVVLHSFGMLHATPSDPTLQAVLKRLRCVLPHSKPADVSMSVWGLARMLRPPPDAWWDALERWSQPCLAQFSPQELSNVLWAAARLQHTPNQAWLHALYAASSPTVLAGQWSAQATAVMLHSLALLKQQPPQAWLEAVLCSATNRGWEGYTPQGMALMIEALGMIGYDPGLAWLDRFHARLNSWRGKLDKRVPDMVSSAFKVLRYVPSSYRGHIRTGIGQQLENSGQQHISEYQPVSAVSWDFGSDSEDDVHDGGRRRRGRTAQVPQRLAKPSRFV